MCVNFLTALIFYRDQFFNALIQQHWLQRNITI